MNASVYLPWILPSLKWTTLLPESGSAAPPSAGGATEEDAWDWEWVPDRRGRRRRRRRRLRPLSPAPKRDSSWVIGPRRTGASSMGVGDRRRPLPPPDSSMAAQLSPPFKKKNFPLPLLSCHSVTPHSRARIITILPLRDSVLIGGATNPRPNRFLKYFLISFRFCHFAGVYHNFSWMNLTATNPNRIPQHFIAG
jgi:hypothetical protein